MIEIIDNFLDEEEFKSIQSLMMGKEFNWFYSEGKSYDDDGSYQMIHMFFQPDIGSNSKHINIWNTFMNKVEAKKCERIKANLTFNTPTIEPADFHYDYNNGKTAVFYINTNNGYTEFESGVRVSSVANRVCIFDSPLQHRGTSHTEGGNQRVVVNFNYE
tara:strand:- start:23 stop:502 length:480 start_codon:yes stop_codon:yes gene_type:complete